MKLIEAPRELGRVMKARLLGRLKAAHPGWSVYSDLIQLVESLDFERVETDYLGNFIIHDSRLVFSDPDTSIFPRWMPTYVSALHGLKSSHWEYAGGYAASFDYRLAQRGAVFSPAGNDVELGFPLIDIPQKTYGFQANASGAVFFINEEKLILYPNNELGTFEVLDDLDEFTQVNIRQALRGKTWLEAYGDRIRTRLMD